MNSAIQQARTRDIVLRTAAHGATPWLVYAAVERFVAIMPRLLDGAEGYVPSSRPFSILLLATYAAVGSISSLPAAISVPPSVSDDRRETISTAIPKLLLTLFFGLNFASEILTRGIAGVSGTLYSVALLIQISSLASAVIWATTKPRRMRLLRPLTNSWMISVLLLGPWFLIFRIPNATRTGKLVAVILFLAAALMIAYATAFVSRRFSLPEYRSMNAAVAIVVFLLCLVPGQTVRDELAAARRRPAGKQLNVILITLDTVSANHLSLYGYGRATSPELARFSRKARFYTRAYSSADITLTTHASLFTGISGTGHGAHIDREHRLGRRLSPGYRTLAEHLAGEGYVTSGVVANAAILGSQFGLSRGFQYYDSRVPVPPLAPVPEYFIGRSVRDFLCSRSPQSRCDAVTYAAGHMNQEVLAVLERIGPNRPFFLFINYMDAHWPYLPPQSFATRYLAGVEVDSEAFNELVRGGRPTAEQSRNLIARYDASIASLDQRIGELLNELDRRQLSDNTLIIITSDHGEAFGERGYVSHGFSVYEDQVRIPLIIKVPGESSGQIFSRPTSSVDLYPTILEVLGLPKPAHLEGKSLLQSLLSDTGILTEHFSPDGLHVRALISEESKFIQSENGDEELYDLRLDPTEKANLLPGDGQDAIASDQRRALKSLVADSQRKAIVARSASPPDSHLLRSLGYVQ